MIELVNVIKVYMSVEFNLGCLICLESFVFFELSSDLKIRIDFKFNSL